MIVIVIGAVVRQTLAVFPTPDVTAQGLQLASDAVDVVEAEEAVQDGETGGDEGDSGFDQGPEEEGGYED